LISVFPQPTYEENIQIYKSYDTKKNRLEVELTRQEEIYPMKLNEIIRYARGHRLLDIGAGLGTFAHMAEQLDFDVTGIELSQEQSKRAKELYGINLINMDIFECYRELGKFDVIHMHHVLEHLLSPSRLFSILGNLVNSNGILVIEVPYQLQRIQDPLYHLARRENTSKWYGDHLYFFSPKTLKNYIELSGFHVIKFGQHRIQKSKDRTNNDYGYYLRVLFHKITTHLQIPSGDFIEFYAARI